MKTPIGDGRSALSNYRASAKARVAAAPRSPTNPAECPTDRIQRIDFDHYYIYKALLRTGHDHGVDGPGKQALKTRFTILESSVRNRHRERGGIDGGGIDDIMVGCNVDRRIELLRPVDAGVSAR